MLVSAVLDFKGHFFSFLTFFFLCAKRLNQADKGEFFGPGKKGIRIMKLFFKMFRGALFPLILKWKKFLNILTCAEGEVR